MNISPKIIISTYLINDYCPLLGIYSFINKNSLGDNSPPNQPSIESEAPKPSTIKPILDHVRPYSFLYQDDPCETTSIIFLANIQMIPLIMTQALYYNYSWIIQ